MAAKLERFLPGVGASPGIAIGRAMVVPRYKVQVAYRPLQNKGEAEDEVARFEAALMATQADLLPRPAKTWAPPWPTTPTSSMPTCSSWATG